MFKVETEELKQLESDLKQMAVRSFPFATKHTLNDMAFEARRKVIQRLPSQFTLRNKWTERTILVEKALTLHIPSQVSAVGSTQKYMADQESGKTEVSKGKHGVPIPTSFSAGQKRARQRTRLVRARHKLSRMKLIRTQRGTRRQRTVLSVREAIKTRKRYVFLDLGRRKGIFRVVGGTKRNASRARLQMVSDLSKRVIHIPSSPWLAPATKLPDQYVQDTYRKALIYQLLRIKSMR